LISIRRRIVRSSRGTAPPQRASPGINEFALGRFRRRRRRRRRLVVTDWFAHARERGIRESRVGRRIAARLKLVRVLLFYSVLLGRGIGVA